MLFVKKQANYFWSCTKYVTRMSGQITEFVEAATEHAHINQ
jgi:hypothetical protein